ncbi:MAG: NAD-dependent epimerase/dehydratase family protein [Vicinamibacterales bacterium]
MKTLVTGATGFTGSYLVRHLAAAGHEVRALARDPEEATTLGDKVSIVRGDLLERPSIKAACQGIDVVYNIAALYRQAGLPKEAYQNVNARAVGWLIEDAAEAGVKRVVHCSTVGVHGDVEHPPANEDAPLRPGDVYQWTKLEGESIARQGAARTGIELVIARPSGIYGPGDRRLLKLFKGVAHGRFLMLGKGDIFYHLTYIDDLVEGFRLCGDVPAAAGRTYILAGGDVGTLKDLVARIAAIAGVAPPKRSLPVWPVWIAGAVCEAICAPLKIEPPLYRRRVDFFTKSRAFDISRASAELGYAPQVGLDEGIRRTLAWYREYKWI